MAIEIRPIRDDELGAFSRCQSIVFGRDYKPEMVDSMRRQIFEFDRSLGAFDGDEIVGTAGAFTYGDMGTPGGHAPVGGLTMVSVLSTHRRQGILSSMIGRHLDDCRSRGEVMSALWASESIIYGRYGYGMAAQICDFKIDKSHAKLVDGPPALGRMRMVMADEVREQWPAFWDQVRAVTPGMMPRSAAWWRTRVFDDPVSWRNGMTENRYVNYEVDGEPRGYIRYRIKDQWSARSLPESTVHVAELMALDSDAYRALWQYAFSLDLTASIEASFRTVEEPIAWMLEDPRRLQQTTHDSLWLRLLDVPRSLEARRYQASDALVIEVTDPFLPETGGRFLLEGSREGASCTRTDRAADLSMGVPEISAAYLGGVRFATLARAGRVTGPAQALARADAMFGWDRAPWCPEMF